MTGGPDPVYVVANNSSSLLYVWIREYNEARPLATASRRSLRYGGFAFVSKEVR